MQTNSYPKTKYSETANVVKLWRYTNAWYLTWRHKYMSHSWRNENKHKSKKTGHFIDEYQFLIDQALNYIFHAKLGDINIRKQITKKKLKKYYGWRLILLFNLHLHTITKFQPNIQNFLSPLPSSVGRASTPLLGVFKFTHNRYFYRTLVPIRESNYDIKQKISKFDRSWWNGFLEVSSPCNSMENDSQEKETMTINISLSMNFK